MGGTVGIECANQYFAVVGFQRFPTPPLPNNEGRYYGLGILWSDDGVNWPAANIEELDEGAGERIYNSIAPRDLRDPNVLKGSEFDVYQVASMGDRWDTADISRLSFVDTAVESACVDGSAPVVDDRPVLSIAPASAGLERDSTSAGVGFQVQLDRPLDHALVVSYWTEDLSAVGTLSASSGDYYRFGTRAVPRTITIPAGVTQQTLSVPVFPDTLKEEDEQFAVHVRSGDGSLRLGHTRAVGTIRDEDRRSPAHRPLIEIVDGAASFEGDSPGNRKGKVTVALTKPAAVPIVVQVSTHDGSARSGAGADFRAETARTLTLAPGQMTSVLDVAFFPNDAASGDLFLWVSMRIVSGPPDLVFHDQWARLVIVDDDA